MNNIHRAGIQDDEVFPWGIAKAKVSLKVCDRLKDSANGNYVVVTGINPTPLGEGKSSTFRPTSFFFYVICIDESYFNTLILN